MTSTDPVSLDTTLHTHALTHIRTDWRGHLNRCVCVCARLLSYLRVKSETLYLTNIIWVSLIFVVKTECVCVCVCVCLPSGISKWEEKTACVFRGLSQLTCCVCVCVLCVCVEGHRTEWCQWLEDSSQVSFRDYTHTNKHKHTQTHTNWNTKMFLQSCGLVGCYLNSVGGHKTQKQQEVPIVWLRWPTRFCVNAECTEKLSEFVWDDLGLWG